MQKNTVFEDEIIFFDAEILDDDDDAPVGTLVTRQETPDTPAPAQESAIIDEPVAPQIDEKEPEADSVVAPVEEPVVATKVDAPQKAIESTTAPAVKVAKPAKTGQISLSDSFSKNSMDMSYDYAIDLTPAPKAEPKKAKAPAKPKTPPVKKEFSEADIWGTATLTPKKKAEPIKEETKPEEKPAPAPKAEPKKAKAPAKANDKPSIQAEAQPVKETPTKSKMAKTKAQDEPVTAPAPAEQATAPVKKTRKKTETKLDANNVEINKTNEEENKVAKEAKEIKEQILVEGEGKYHGKFVIKKTDKGHFVYKLFAYGNKCVAIGAQAYEGLSGCKGGIASVQRIAATAPIENQTLKSYETLKFPKWEIYADKKGEFRLRLYASNGNLVATTNDGYLSVGAAKKGIESVAHAAEGAAIVRNDDLW